MKRIEEYTNSELAIFINRRVRLLNDIIKKYNVDTKPIGPITQPDVLMHDDIFSHYMKVSRVLNDAIADTSFIEIWR